MGRAGYSSRLPGFPAERLPYKALAADRVIQLIATNSAPELGPLSMSDEFELEGTNPPIREAEVMLDVLKGRASGQQAGTRFLHILGNTRVSATAGLGYTEGFTYDYKRHGTTTLFAALDVLNGSVLTDPVTAPGVPGIRVQHRIQWSTAAGCAPDHGSATLTSIPESMRGSHADHAGTCISFPSTASGSSRSSAFIALITDKAIRRGSFTSVKDWIAKIDHFVTEYNKRSVLSSGQPQRTPSWGSSIYLRHELVGQDTSWGSMVRSRSACRQIPCSRPQVLADILDLDIA
jgi:putative transposase